MIIYHYDAETGAYVGAGEADKSPLEKNVFIIPAFATTITPPAQQAGFVTRFVDGVWGYSPVEDPESPPTEDPEPFTPAQISRRQFFQQLAIEQRITEGEALAAVAAGTIPAAMDALIELLPVEQQFSARMLVSGATEFLREHPVTLLIGQLYGFTPSDIDRIWREAALL